MTLIIILLLLNSAILFEKLQKESWYFLSQTDWISSLLLKKDSKILEVGSGPGILSNYLFGLGFSIFGVDISKKMLKRARKNFPHIKFYQNTDDFSPNSFDVIIGSSILNLIDDKKDFLDSYYKYLKIGGKMSFLVPSNFMSSKKANEFIKSNKMSYFGKNAMKFWFSMSKKMSYEELESLGKNYKSYSINYHFDKNLVSLTIEKVENN